MAYARFGEGSDIYLFKTGGGRMICASCALQNTDVVFQSKAYGEIGTHLLEHVAKGHRVPGHVFARLYAESEGLPYETDVERVVKELAAGAGECICRTASCGHLAKQHGPGGVCEVCGVDCWL